MSYIPFAELRAKKRLFLFSLIIFLISPALWAAGTIDVVPDDTVNGAVELTPGYIAGTVDIGGQSISQIQLAAQSREYSAKINLTAEGPYSMTVNVPMGDSAYYEVSGMVYMDSYNTRLYFKNRPTTVAEGQTAQVDFIVDAGYLVGNILTDGCSVAKGEVWAVLDDGSRFSRAHTRFGSSGTFRLPVQPNAGIRVYGQIQLVSGATYNLSEQYITVSPGQDAQVSWDFACGAGSLGAIQSDINYHMPVDYHYSYLYSQGAWSPYQIERHAGSILFDQLAPGNWRLYTYSYWNDGHNLIGRYMTNVEVLAGQTANVAIDEQPGFLQGKVSLKGTKTIADTSYSYVYADGKSADSISQNMLSRSMINTTDGSYNLALPSGEWNVYRSMFYFYNPDTSNWLHENLYMYDYSRRNDKVVTTAGQIIAGHNLTYETGSATIKYSRSDGGSFSAPYIYAKCYNRDESGTVREYIYSYSRGAANGDRVTFVGFPGTYEVEAWATVNGSLTTFGKVIVEVVSGVEKVVDIGGPVLTVQSPSPGTITAESVAAVSGTATDESGVNQITVNGKAAALHFTGNSDDPNEVSFSVEIVLVEGENSIKTVATDYFGNSSSDARTIIYQILEPEPEPEPETEADISLVDIKPGSCKNPLNITSKGVLPVVVLGSGDFDVSEIDVDSIRLVGVAPLRSVLADDATVIYPAVDSNADEICDTDMPDGYTDLVLKFDTQEIVAALGAVKDGDIITLTLSGVMLDGSGIEDEDRVTILAKGKKNK